MGPRVAGRRAPGAQGRTRGARRARKRSLTVALADDKRVRALNKRDRRKDKPTNVLSYPSGEKSVPGRRRAGAPDRSGARRGRRRRRRPIIVAHLVVHGTLHLLGHDHETSEVDAERMEALERRILARLGIADPYEAR